MLGLDSYLYTIARQKWQRMKVKSAHCNVEQLYFSTAGNLAIGHSPQLRVDAIRFVFRGRACQHRRLDCSEGSETEMEMETEIMTHHRLHVDDAPGP